MFLRGRCFLNWERGVALPDSLSRTGMVKNRPLPTTCFASFTLDTATTPVSKTSISVRPLFLFRILTAKCSAFFVITMVTLLNLCFVFIWCDHTVHVAFVASFAQSSCRRSVGCRCSNCVLCCPTGASSHYKLPPHHGQPRSVAGRRRGRGR